MKFSILINKWANFYFFVQNLAKWHFSNRKSFNLLWKKELGPFTKKEREALKRLKKLHLKYGFNQKLPYLGSFFYLSKHPWKALEDRLTQREVTILKKIFLMFQPKFESLWQKDSLLLKQWQEKLTQRANNKTLIHSIDQQLSIFYKARSPRNIRVYLLLAPRGIGGTANPGGPNITLEISRFPLRKLNIASGLIWHETIHAHYEKQFFLSLLNKKFPRAQDKRLKKIIQEATVQAFFPFGILGKQLLKIKEPEDLPKYVKPLSRIIQKYLKSKQAVDFKYFEQAAAIFSNSGKTAS
jgi:hypothetical protein